MDDAIYAWQECQPDGSWNIIGFASSHGWMPMVTSRLSTAQAMKATARMHGRERGTSVRLARFAFAEALEAYNVHTIYPQETP